MIRSPDKDTTLISSLVATVAVAAPLDTTLFYAVPKDLQGTVQVGVRVRVPLGRRSIIGYLLGLEKGETEGLKAIAEVLDAKPLFPEQMVSFFIRSAEYYCHPIGEVIRTALPAGLSDTKARVAILAEHVYAFTQKGGNPSGAKQCEILSFVRKRKQVGLSELREHFPAPYSPLKRLVELGFLKESSQERLRDPFFSQPIPPDSQVVLNAEQQEALDRVTETLNCGGFAPFLLHGVTGSGKTEVYLRSIKAALALGKRALVLVPEIALTPQLVGRFRSRFSDGDASIAVLHSGLSDGERYDAWRAIARGDVHIVIGARSAVFAPLTGLGIIIVDEEHEGSYKQGEGFRYHARDLALFRGQMSETIVLLGSATPALTTYHRARSGQTGYLPLTGRVLSRSLPPVELVDLKKAKPRGILSQELLVALQNTLARREQALLLLNRRGFAPFLLCADCGTTFRCPNCEITLTYYQGRRQLRCHYCDHVAPPPDSCPSCGGRNIHPKGAGTERLEEELTVLFPGVRIARMDRDTTVRKGIHQKLVDSMTRGEVDILVGTQMIAKGHDFPGVTLVGVINADAALNFPDFRSAERTFALLTQVAGRAGRGERPGRVLIQTYAPDHYALTCAAAHDYHQFYDQEISFRRALDYPPFGFLVNLVLVGNDTKKVDRAAAALAGKLKQEAREVEILGPAPCPLAKLRGKKRVQILLKASRRPPLRRLLVCLAALQKSIPAGVRLVVDVDPLDML
jgi:primosomal protein N' (replication factor Y) (superfamily II helicase)